MPRTVVEAAACGVPLVATDVGSIDELVEDRRSGRLVEPGDVTAMSAALVELHLDPAGAAALAAVARARTDPFSAGNMRRELVTLWREVAGRPSPVAPSAEAPVGPITGEAPALGIPSR